MTTRLAPWQRLNIAIARGVLLAPSGNMKWIANCTLYTTSPNAGSTFNLIDFAADSEFDAARFAAEAAAKRFYGTGGSTGFVTEIVDTDKPLYLASIGIYDNGVTKGHSIQILIRPYRHPVN